MISKITTDYIGNAISEELRHAREQHGDNFASWHEAESVIREEIEELQEECSRLRYKLDGLHNGLRGNDASMMNSMCVQMQYIARHAAEEAVQVAAMCKKAVREK